MTQQPGVANEYQIVNKNTISRKKKFLILTQVKSIFLFFVEYYLREDFFCIVFFLIFSKKLNSQNWKQGNCVKPVQSGLIVLLIDHSSMHKHIHAPYYLIYEIFNAEDKIFLSWF